MPGRLGKKSELRATAVWKVASFGRIDRRKQRGEEVGLSLTGHARGSDSLSEFCEELMNSVGLPQLDWRSEGIPLERSNSEHSFHRTRVEPSGEIAIVL
jgi:hypothetical protein